MEKEVSGLSEESGVRDEEAIQAANELEKRLGETRSQIEFLARNITAAAHTLSTMSGSVSTRDSILDKFEVTTRYMARLNLLTRELADVSAVIGLDMTPVHSANYRTAEEYQRAVAIVGEFEEDSDDTDNFVEEMDQLIGERSSLINPNARRIKNIQEAVSHVLRDMFRTSHPSSTTPTLNPSTPPKDALNKPPSTPARKTKPNGHVIVEPDGSPPLAALPSSANESRDDVTPLLLPDDGVAAVAASPSSSSTMTGWQKARRVLIPLAGGVAGALLLGPAGLVIGFKGATVIAASAAVGASVGAISGTAVSVKLDRDLKATMAQTGGEGKEEEEKKEGEEKGI